VRVIHHARIGIKLKSFVPVSGGEGTARPSFVANGPAVWGEQWALLVALPAFIWVHSKADLQFVGVRAVGVVSKIDPERVCIRPHGDEVASFAIDDGGRGEVHLGWQEGVGARVHKGVGLTHIPRDAVQADVPRRRIGTVLPDGFVRGDLEQVAAVYRGGDLQDGHGGLRGGTRFWGRGLEMDFEFVSGRTGGSVIQINDQGVVGSFQRHDVASGDSFKADSFERVGFRQERDRAGGGEIIFFARIPLRAIDRDGPGGPIPIDVFPQCALAGEDDPVRSIHHAFEVEHGFVGGGSIGLSRAEWGHGDVLQFRGELRCGGCGTGGA